MAIPWLIALKAIPWSRLLTKAPALVLAADSLLSGLKKRRLDAASATDLQRLADRVTLLEKREEAYVDLLKQISTQVDALTTTTEVLAARQRWLLAFTIVASALGILAIGLVLAMHK